MNRVRPAGPDDVEELASLLIEFHTEAGFQRTRAEAAGKFRPLLAAPELGQAWLLEADGQPAGFVVLTVCFSMDHGGLRGFVDDFGAQRLSSGWLCRHQAPASQGRVEPTGALRRGW